MPSDTQIDRPSGSSADPSQRAVSCTVNGQEFVRVELDGRTVMVQPKCPHKGASMAEAYVAGELLICVRHGATFDLRTGRLVRGPQCADIQLFTVEGEEPKEAELPPGLA